MFLNVTCSSYDANEDDAAVFRDFYNCFTFFDWDIKNEKLRLLPLLRRLAVAILFFSLSMDALKLDSISSNDRFISPIS